MALRQINYGSLCLETIILSKLQRDLPQGQPCWQSITATNSKNRLNLVPDSTFQHTDGWAEGLVK